MKRHEQKPSRVTLAPCSFRESTSRQKYFYTIESIRNVFQLEKQIDLDIHYFFSAYRTLDSGLWSFQACLAKLY